ncbi:MAG: protoheme IX farnesyltransferase [Chloroflexi bacterium]|nr:protoheme IX farnesyltransferase [Chloroflexota bacterium]
MAVAAAPAARSTRAATWRRVRQAMGLVIVLGKARVVGLVTFTALVGAVVGAGGHPSPLTLLAVLSIGVFAGGGAGALNHVLDRDIDRQMSRTRHRPIVAGEVRPGAVMAGGLASLVAGLAIAWASGPMVAFHTAIAAATYVLVYTRLLKRYTPRSVVIGGWTGAAAVLAGWEATGRPLTVTALALSAVVFLWTPAHFWGLAIARVDDYRRAGVPALPILVGVRATTWAVVASALATAVASVIPILTGGLGSVYAAVLACSAVFWGVPVWQLLARATPRRAWRAYKASGLFLLLVFLGALIETLARAV